jgi:ketosteroid isomerase-like protein
MSEENVDVVRQIFEAINRGDLDEAFTHVSADFIADWSASLAPDRGVFHGPDAVRAALETANEAWSEVDYFESETIDLGDIIVRVGGIRARGEGSGAEVTARGAQVWRFRDGVPVSVRFHQDKESALADAEKARG